MKKTILTLVCAIAALSVSAQRASSSSSSFFSTESTDEKVTFGVRGGVNFSNNSFINDGNTRTGFHAGVIIDIPFVESFGLQTGLFYSSKGTSYEALDGDIEETISMNYLELPILASYRYNFNEATQFQFNTGPYVAYGLSGTLKVKEYGGITQKADFFDFDDTKRFDVGWQVGCGLKFAKNFYIGVAYEFGFMNVVDDAKSKNSNFMVSAGVQF